MFILFHKKVINDWYKNAGHIITQQDVYEPVEIGMKVVVNGQC